MTLTTPLKTAPTAPTIPADNIPAEFSPEVALARSLVDQAQSITVLTGAGISTDSGIPDFRGPKGIWTKDPEAEKMSNIVYYVNDPAVRRRNWELRACGELWAEVDPNPGHYALVHLEQRDKLNLLITQNIDELHLRAGNSADKVVEVHGTTRKVGCLECDYLDDMEVALERVRAGEADPHCLDCGGILKSATISFGQQLDPIKIALAEHASQTCDLFLAIGTSLAVYPINQTVLIAKASGAKLVIINAEPTELDHYANVVLQENISAVLPAIVGMPADT